MTDAIKFRACQKEYAAAVKDSANTGKPSQEQLNDAYEFLETQEDKECECHINPPCGYCEGIPELFVEILAC